VQNECKLIYLGLENPLKDNALIRGVIFQYLQVKNLMEMGFDYCMTSLDDFEAKLFLLCDATFKDLANDSKLKPQPRKR